MKKGVGISVDHHKAVIVTIENEGAVALEVLSNMEKRDRLSSGTHMNTFNDSQGSSAEAMRDRLKNIENFLFRCIRKHGNQRGN